MTIIYFWYIHTYRHCKKNHTSWNYENPKIQILPTFLLQIFTCEKHFKWKLQRNTFCGLAGKLNIVGTASGLNLVVCPVLSKLDGSKWSEQRKDLFPGSQFSLRTLYIQCFRTLGRLNGKLEKSNIQFQIWVLDYITYSFSKVRPYIHIHISRQ